MNEKREFPRYACNLSVKFSFYEGNPDELDTETAKQVKDKGIIIDISKSGVFLVSNSRVNINMPINLVFTFNKDKININGLIVRTGLMKNNPSELAKKYSGKKVKGDAYIAVKFDNLIDNIF